MTMQQRRLIVCGCLCVMVGVLGWERRQSWAPALIMLGAQTIMVATNPPGRRSS